MAILPFKCENVRGLIIKIYWLLFGIFKGEENSQKIKNKI
jgi:hypothetical protein